mmetsp:Transcript_32548/g.79003  ORF Transcript_32548/g.79003 Transcript_32548/m.79003 type:complete len:641 (-) Transcript_32548:26-1948(-)
MSSAAPSHVTETIADRKKSRELAEARQSGAMAPAVDVKTGAMINPHNPDFITKRPWYLGGNDTGPSLDHQTVDKDAKERVTLSLNSADLLVKEERRKLKEKQKRGKFEAGMWVEAMRNNKGPYRICQIVKIAKKGTQFDLKYEDGTIERKVKFKPSKKKLFNKPRIRMTKTGARSIHIDEEKHGHESYDSKRDTYHGYDHETHTKRIEKTFAEREEIRKQLREKKKKERAENPDSKKEKDVISDSDLDSDVESGDDSDDEFVQNDEDDRVLTTRLARQGGVGGAQMKVTARNLRIREDTAKYLRNLDANSAYYDPKSRSMRQNPNPEIPSEEAPFAGDNFARISGDAVNLAQTQMFAWDATAKSGTDELHPQANPSQVELLKKKFQKKSADLAVQKKRKVLDKYGGQEYLDGSGGLATAVEEKNTSSKQSKIRFGVSTVNQEYSRDGRLLKGSVAKAKQVALKSKYEEDIYPNGHTSVWGSFFHIAAFSWGYDCDHSLIKNSYGTGLNGRKANDKAHLLQYGTGVAGSAALAQARGMLKAIPSGQRGQGNGKFEPPSNRSKMYGEADQKAIIDQDKVKAALEGYDKKEQESMDTRKRKYNSVESNVDVTDAEMEAYRLRKEKAADPMAKISSDELLDYSK